MAGNFAGLYGMEWVGRKVVADLRQELFGAYVGLPATFYDRFSSGQLISKLAYNSEQVANAATTSVVSAFRDVLLVIFLLGTALGAEIYVRRFRRFADRAFDVAIVFGELADRDDAFGLEARIDDDVIAVDDLPSFVDRDQSVGVTVERDHDNRMSAGDDTADVHRRAADPGWLLPITRGRSRHGSGDRPGARRPRPAMGREAP